MLTASGDFSEFLNLDNGTGLVEENDTVETHPPLDRQMLGPPQTTTDVSDEFRRREMELQLEETELELKRNKPEQESLALQCQELL